MHVTVHYLAQLKRLAGVAEERLEVPVGATLAHAIQQLAAAHGADFRSIVLGPSLLIFVNDAQVTSSATLSDGDRITLLTPMAGG